MSHLSNIHRSMQPRNELLTHTLLRLMERWPNMKNTQRNRFAGPVQEWRELRSELDDQERQFSIDNDLLVQIPHLADGLRDSSAALAAAYGDPVTQNRCSRWRWMPAS